MNLLDEGNTAEYCIHSIQSWRRNALDGAIPPADSAYEDIMRARMQVCDYLANEDDTIWQDLVRGRTTQIIILASGMAVYGGLLDDVQFMALNRPFLTALEKRQPGGFRDVFEWLQSLLTRGRGTRSRARTGRSRMTQPDTPAHPVVWGKAPEKEDDEAPVTPPLHPGPSRTGVKIVRYGRSATPVNR